MSANSSKTLFEELLQESDPEELIRRAIAISISKWRLPYHEAQDLVQCCLWKASRYVPPGDVDHNPWHLLIAMLKNQTIDRARKRKRFSEILSCDLDSANACEKYLPQDKHVQLKLDLQSAIASMPDTLVETLEKLEYHGGNREATGADLGISGTGVRYRCKRIQSILVRQVGLMRDGTVATQ